MDAKIPENIKKTPRCPLCYAMFDRRHNEIMQQRLEVLVVEAVAAMKAATNDKELAKTKRWGEILEASIKAGAAETFLCHHCKIGIACNDPFVDGWEAAYAKGEKLFCPACDHEMRFFCTSTGFMLAQCPVKKCRARMQISSPDRLQAPASDQVLLDDKGVPIALPNIDRPVATPGQMSDAQVGGSGGEASLPDITTIRHGEGSA